MHLQVRSVCTLYQERPPTPGRLVTRMIWCGKRLRRGARPSFGRTTRATCEPRFADRMGGGSIFDAGFPQRCSRHIVEGFIARSACTKRAIMERTLELERAAIATAARKLEERRRSHAARER